MLGLRLNSAPAAALVRLTDGEHTAEIVAREEPVCASRWIERVAEGWLVNDVGSSFVINETRPDSSALSSASNGAILSPMPGRIIAVDVAAGDSVTKGQKLVTLEAMKMEHSLTAPFDGTIGELNAEIGGQVQEGVVLVRLDSGA